MRAFILDALIPAIVFGLVFLPLGYVSIWIPVAAFGLGLLFSGYALWHDRNYLRRLWFWRRRREELRRSEFREQ